MMMEQYSSQMLHKISTKFVYMLKFEAHASLFPVTSDATDVLEKRSYEVK